MVRSVAGVIGVAVLSAILAAGCASKPAEQQKDSGFLRDYSRLQEAKTADGATIRAWVSPKLAPDNYNAIMLDPLIFYPEPRPTDKVTADSLQQILKYSNDTLKQALSKRFKIVDRPGPGVLRIRSAFSSVGAEAEGLKAYQYVPMAFIATMASRAATGEPQRAFIVIEVEGTDSVSGQLLASRVRVGTGKSLAEVGGKDQITFETVKPLLDELAAGAFPELSKYVKAR